jgi:hypothetical protein
MTVSGLTMISIASLTTIVIRGLDQGEAEEMIGDATA